MNLVALGELVEIKGGGTPDKSVAEYWDGDIPWASVKDFKSGILDKTIDKISQRGVASSATQIIRAGSIIVPTRMAVGKVAINTIDLAINQDLKALMPKSGVDIRFLYHALLANGSKLEEQATGATVKGIKLDVLRNLEIPLPPPEKQKRIAAILDQADALRRLRRRALNRLNTLRQAIFHEMFGDRAPAIALADIAEINPKRRFSPSDDFTVTFLPMASVGEDGFIHDEQSRSLEDVRKGFTYFERGDLLVAKITPCFENGKGGDTRIISNQVGFGSTEFHVLRPSQPEFTDFIHLVLQSCRFRTEGERAMTGSAGQKRIPSDFIKSYRVPVPSPQELGHLSDALASLTSSLSGTKHAVATADDLFTSLQHRAFRGEL
ncbi:restriction endonuclease subunit S [Falsirhodobacter algicola]|uniref:Restriction endonuclease subunit S n=1 Tax=Falsirhodobacter algicola TaxID=2692330 RepID=A0A8J8MTU5_9RHOB|nr:restriction endonuclease subunit S [Falsirhodobacter algicola]QUS36369.1 restriction endonuclease subunit S [Falsirhodobacter algicola]